MNKIVYCNKIPDMLDNYLVIIDGKSNTTKLDFLHCIWEQLRFPEIQNCNWNAYLDWMRDLSWIDSKIIDIVILNFDSFLSEEPESLKHFIVDLEEIVFPFWQNDAESVFENQDAVKDITVYCVNGEFLKQEQISTREAILNIEQTALNRQKVPHAISLPVLRMHNNKLCFAAFVFFFNREQLQSAKIKRPSIWVVGDLRTGRVTHKYSCLENEFSNSDYQKFYSISSDGVLSLSRHSWNSIYLLMDIIRNEYFKTGNIRMDLYQSYLGWIRCTTSEECQIFYTDLSNI